MGELFDTSRAYGVTVNGRIHAELRARRNNPPVTHEIAGFLDRLDGTSRFSVTLWELPPGTRFEDVDLEEWPQRYLQAAGHRDRMTVEIRRDGEPGRRQFVVGRGDTVEIEPSDEVRWGAVATTVLGVELFTAAEAVPLFLSYWQTNDVPDGYRLRPLEL